MMSCMDASPTTQYGFKKLRRAGDSVPPGDPRKRDT